MPPRIETLFHEAKRNNPLGVLLSKRSPLVQSVERVVSILKSFSASEPELGVGEISRRVGIPKSTVFRLLATLEEGKLISQNPDTGLYRLGIDLLVLANNAMISTDLQRVARPLLRHLVSDLNETVTLTVLDRQDVVNLELFVSSERMIMRVGWVGRRMPVHATSSGKAIIAFKTEEEQKSILPSELEGFTPQTVTNHSQLKADLLQVREKGYAIALEELEPGLNALAVPIRNHEGEVIACVSVSGPSHRFTEEYIYEIIPKVLKTSTQLSSELGYKRGF
jgi:DNA-binding IclR family transcriptional regulator